MNTRLSAEEVRYILDHSGATVLVVDSALLPAVDPIRESLQTVREVVVHVDAEGPDAGSGSDGYAELLARGDDGEDLPWAVDDERGTISINYTSGTTGKPKGVQYHHRGAYLNSLGEIIQSYHDPATVYLWTLPMFHCNGWCTPWGITAIGGTHVCLREVRGDAIWALIGEHRVTHLNGAPTVVTTIMNAAEARTLDYALVVTTAGAPPSPTTILEMERMGFRIVHVYGLTETYGPYTVCQWQDAWASLSDTERAKLQSRQGVGMIQTDAVRVVEVLPEDYDPGFRRARRRPRRRHDHGRDRHARQQRHERLLPRRRGDGQGVRGRLVPLGRPRGHAPRRLRRAPRPRQGRDHLRWREHLDRRGGAGGALARGGAGGRGRRRPRRALGGAAEGVRRPASRGGRSSPRRSSST